MASLSFAEKPISKLRGVLIGEKSDKKRGLIPTAVLGTGAEIAMKTVDNIFGSNIQRLASFNLPLIGTVGPIDVLNFFIFGGIRNMRGGITAVIGSKVLGGGLASIGPISLPGSSGLNLSEQSSTAAGQLGGPV